MKRALFHCQHVLGMGHLVRAVQLVHGMRDFEVCFLNGGEPVEGFVFPDNVRILNLPALSCDENFLEIRTGREDDLHFVKEQRREMLIAAVDDVRPDLVITELFPFGRRKFSYELVPMLRHIRELYPATKVACSVRDIVVGKRDRDAYESKVRALLDELFDLVLVHSDPTFQDLRESFASVDQIRCPVRYTGFVVRKPDSVANVPQHKSDGTQIVASIGGGRVGLELLQAVVSASVELRHRLNHQIAMFAGPFMPEEDYLRLAHSVQESSVTVSRFSDSLPRLLSRADLSISMAGYNTCMEILASGVPSLLLPFTGGGNLEQATRAYKLQRIGAATVLQESDLHPARMAEKIESAIRPRSADQQPIMNLNGVHNTNELLKELVRIQ